MDKVQIIDRRNIAPSSKTLRDELVRVLSVILLLFTALESKYFESRACVLKEYELLH
jgi:hypothetical protein